ncbi:MAG: tetratricopeptide repeat protein [Pirellulaceae bacterium]
MELVEYERILRNGQERERRSDFSGAEKIYCSLLLQDQSSGEAWFRLGVVVLKQNKHSLAVESFQNAIACHYRRADASNLLGVALAGQERIYEAENAFRGALDVQPEHLGARVNLARSLADQGRTDEAVQAYLDAVELDAANPAAFEYAAAVLESLQRTRDAALCGQVAALLRSPPQDFHYQLAIRFSDLGFWDHAVHHYRHALSAHPANTELLVGMGAALAHLSQFEDAKSYYHRALQISPSMAQAQFNLSMLELLQGEWQQGWQRYEMRWRTPEFAGRSVNHRLWDGRPFPNQTVFLHCEQGFGESIQFCRYAALVKQRGGTVLLGCPSALMPLLRGCAGVDAWIDSADTECEVHFQAPLISLPRIFATTPVTVPCPVPYLSADPDRVAAWRERLGTNSAFRIAVAWRGNPNYRDDRFRSAPLAALEPLARLPHVRLVSLQKNRATEEIQAVAARLRVEDLGASIDLQGGAFLDTAAIMQCVDLVITVDSAIAHLAGALGVPVWTALAHSSDWRWLRDREDTVWYPTMRLFRQSTPGNWEGVFSRMADALRVQRCPSDAR